VAPEDVAADYLLSNDCLPDREADDFLTREDLSAGELVVSTLASLDVVAQLRRGGLAEDDFARLRGAVQLSVGSGRAAIALRISLGSMKRTSSWTTSNSATSSVPRSRKNSIRRCTSSSGALAPELIPTTRLP
jgi:hypothetical protein